MTEEAPDSSALNQDSTEDTTLRLTIKVPEHLLEAASECLFSAGVSGLVEKAFGYVVYPQSDEQLSAIARALAELNQRVAADRPTDGVTYVADRIKNDWHRTWQDALGPEKVTATFTLRPVAAGPAEEGENTLWYEPSVSFGSGEHPTTRLAASLIERALKESPTLSLFDVGTGTGVLSMIAARLGSESILAVDIDEVATLSAKKNAALNHLTDRIRFQVGSAHSTDDTFHLVVANINTPILVELRDHLIARVARGGTLILTGLLCEDVSDLTRRYGKVGAKLCLSAELNGWGMLTWARPA